MFASKEIAALATSGQATLENVDKVTAQAQALLAAFKVLLDHATTQGITITIKLGTGD